ncbi:MAG: efflux RND transporter periplasmic adaptor subunit [Candidatus Aminicenantes bacterium]|nr:efflux RND transporter periplasmic adaptor subunit [Candidatus Aminicenantes bacterium]
MKTSLFKFVRLASSAAAVAAVLWTGACSSSGNNTSGRAIAESPVSVVPVLQKDMPLEIASVGRVDAISTVSVKAQVGGEVKSVYFKEGQVVRKGDRLLTIEPAPYEIALKQAESLLEKDRALLRNAQAEAARYASLVEKDYVTKQQYDTLVANRDVLTAAIQADEAGVANARLQLAYTTIMSPIDGRTGSLMVNAGNIIKANDTAPVVVIYQTTPIYATFSVSEQYLPRIKEFMAKEPLKTMAIPDANGQPPVTGVLTFIDNSIDSSTGMITLKATFDNRDEALWPGQFVSVRLTLTTDKGVMVVPSQAIQTGQAGQYVYIVKDDLTAEMRPIKVGRTVGEDSIIADGLKPGERVVTDGQLRLTPGTRVAIKAGR